MGYRGRDRSTATRCTSGWIRTHRVDGERFTLDTNILVYAFDARAAERHTTAMRIMDLARTSPCVITLQAVSEFYAVITRKQRVPRPEAAALANNLLATFDTAPASRNALGAALTMASSGLASYWDALLVATAREAGCAVVLTEDLRDGGTLGGLRIVNPFAEAGLSASARTILGLP